MMTETLDPSNLSSPSQTDDVVLSVKGVSKKFCRSLKRSLWYGVQDLAGELVGSDRERDTLRQDEFWALKNASFELRRGECLGLIGRNGAGKTTLLKILNQLILPDEGEIEIKGKIGGLIALGAGFDPILTGRENVYINGSILGLSRKEIEAKFDEIVAFSELEEFIDAPVKGYSSGMQVRLGFAVAAVLIQPDVLLLDEVLAVGDIGFTIKCLNRVQEIAQNSAVVLVTHSLQYLSLFCSRLLLLKQGQVICDTDNVPEGIDKYLSMFPTESNLAGTGQAKISNICLSTQTKSSIEGEELHVNIDDSVRLIFEVDIDEDIEASEIVIIMTNQSRTPLVTFPLVDPQQKKAIFLSGLHKVTVDFNILEFVIDKYSLTIAVKEIKTHKVLARLQGVAPFRITGKERVYWTPIVQKIECKCLSY